MGLDKKQLPQLIVLGVLVVACIGYISFRIAAPKATVAPPAAQADGQANAIAEADSLMKEGSSGSEALALLSPGDYPNLSIIPARRDPFTPQPIAGVEDNKFVRISANTIRPTRQLNKLVNPFRVSSSSSKVPSLGTWGTTGRASAVTVLPVQPIVVPEEKDPEFVLTGVVRGEQNVAIIRVGETGRYVVKEDQLIDGRYRVMSVTDDGVILVYKHRSIYLKLGGVTNAS